MLYLANTWHTTNTLHAKQLAQANKLLPKLPTALRVGCTALHTIPRSHTPWYTWGPAAVCHKADSRVLAKILTLTSLSLQAAVHTVRTCKQGEHPAEPAHESRAIRRANHAYWSTIAKEVQPVRLHVLAAHSTGRQK